jgi:hypothetical protein
MLKILPQVHSTNRGATKPSGGAINEDKDFDALARRIRNLSNVTPPPRTSPAKYALVAALLFCFWLIDSIGFYVAVGGASLLWLALYLARRRHAEGRQLSENKVLERRSP